MTVDAAAVAAVAAVASAIFAGLTYRLVRSSAAPSWEVEVLSTPGRDGRSGTTRVVITNVGGGIARDVRVTFHDVFREPTLISGTPDVHPAGRLVYTRPPRAMGRHGNEHVEVTWRSRLGRRRSWTTAFA